MMISDKDLQDYGKKVSQDKFDEVKKKVNTTYINACSDEELNWLHDKIEQEQMYRGIKYYYYRRATGL
jgi:hypothetical protein